MNLYKVRFPLVLLAFMMSANGHAQARKDIRSPIVDGPVLLKDLSKETKVPSLELEQVLSALEQNPMFKAKLVVAEGTPLVAEVEKRVNAKGLVDRIQMVEK